jgi:hypothetical protein
MGDFGNLPPNCPPPEARVISDEIMYRFVVNNPPDRASAQSSGQLLTYKYCYFGFLHGSIERNQ